MRSNRHYRVGVIPGDGIGPEVVDQALIVLREAAVAVDFIVDTITYPWSAQHYLDSGELMPESALGELSGLDAILLGALGDPRVEPGLLERAVLLGIRFGMDLFVNLRPIVLYAERLTPLKNVQPADVDFVVVRENTEDVYAGVGGILGKGTAHETAVAEMVFTRFGVERVIRYAFELARSRNKRKHLTLIDKSNAIRSQEIWRRVLSEVAPEYPDVSTDGLYVDAAVMHMVDNPSRFDVIVTTNLFGDIITDLGAAIQGGLGSAASGNIHPGRTSMFEPIHGSAPDLAGKHLASPVGAISAAAMLLEFVGERASANLIQSSLQQLIVGGDIPSLDARSGLSTEEVGELVRAEVARRAAVAV